MLLKHVKIDTKFILLLVNVIFEIKEQLRNLESIYIPPPPPPPVKWGFDVVISSISTLFACFTDDLL